MPEDEMGRFVGSLTQISLPLFTVANKTDNKHYEEYTMLGFFYFSDRKTPEFQWNQTQEREAGRRSLYMGVQAQ